MIYEYIYIYNINIYYILYIIYIIYIIYNIYNIIYIYIIILYEPFLLGRQAGGPLQVPVFRFRYAAPCAGIPGKARIHPMIRTR